MLGRIKNFFNRGHPVSVGGGSQVIDYLSGLGLDVDAVENSSAMCSEIYYICMKHLSETMGKMPWEKIVMSDKKGKEREFDNDLDILLNVRPNPYYTASTLWSSAELNRNHYGNAYIYIERRQGKPKHLWLLPSEEMTIWVDNAGIFGKKNAVWYQWQDGKSGKTYKFFNTEIMHLKTSTSFDGISGAPVRDILSTQINSQKHAQSFLYKLYKSNMFGSKILVHYTGELERSKELSVAKKLESFSSTSGSGKFIPLPMGMEAKLLDMKLSDAQFTENNKTSALRLAAAFGIKPNVINDYDKSSYASSESQQLDFYVNTLHPIFTALEQEMTYKLLLPSQLEDRQRLAINEKVLFHMDSKTQAEVYSKYVTNFIMTPNEVREELRLPYEEGADKLLGNGNTIDIDNVGTQYGNGGGE